MVGHRLLSFLQEKAVSHIKKVNKKKFTMKASVLCNGNVCEIKVRAYRTGQERRQETLVMLHRLQGDSIAFNALFRLLKQDLTSLTSELKERHNRSHEVHELPAVAQTKTTAPPNSAFLTPLMDAAHNAEDTQAQAEAAASLAAAAEEREEPALHSPKSTKCDTETPRGKLLRGFLSSHAPHCEASSNTWGRGCLQGRCRKALAEEGQRPGQWEDAEATVLTGHGEAEAWQGFQESSLSVKLCVYPDVTGVSRPDAGPRVVLNWVFDWGTVTASGVSWFQETLISRFGTDFKELIESEVEGRLQGRSKLEREERQFLEHFRSLHVFVGFWQDLDAIEHIITATRRERRGGKPLPRKVLSRSVPDLKAQAPPASMQRSASGLESRTAPSAPSETAPRPRKERRPAPYAVSIMEEDDFSSVSLFEGGAVRRNVGL
eukprot:g2439.t1